MITCAILTGYRSRALRLRRWNTLRFLFVGLDEEGSLQNKGAYTRLTARLRFGSCCLHKEM